MTTILHGGKTNTRVKTLINGYHLTLHMLSSGDIMLSLTLTNRTIFYSITKTYLNKQTYKDNPIHLSKSRTIYYRDLTRV